MMSQHTEKFSITLPADMAHLIHEKVGKGFYASNSELIREAMRAWIEQEKNRNLKLEALRQDIYEGLESGESTAWNPEEIKAEARKQRAMLSSVSRED